MIKQIFGFFPRTWRKRSETAASEAASIETRLRHLGPSTDSLLSLGFPQDAALDAALQLSGITNVESVLRRFSPEDIQRVVATIDASEALRPAVHATRFASSEPIKDLLTKIIKGELESPGDAPRSVTELVSRTGKRELEVFLKLRRVLWKDCREFWSNPRSEIYCLQDVRCYPGLISVNELDRLVDVGLVKFGPVPFESHFTGPIAMKSLTFGNKNIMVRSTKPDSTLRLGHFALTSDGRYIIDLYGDEPCEEFPGHLEAVRADWQNQGFEVNNVVVVP